MNSCCQPSFPSCLICIISIVIIIIIYVVCIFFILYFKVSDFTCLSPEMLYSSFHNVKHFVTSFEKLLYK